MRSAAIAIVLASLASASHASAQTKQDCADAYVSAQVDRKEGRLLEARKKFETCNASACPAALRRDCGPWMAQIDKDIPTLEISVEGDAGPIAGARVTVDGAAFDAAGPVDPGDRVVRAEAAGMKPGEQRLTLAAGEGRRKIVIKLERDVAAPREASPSKVPIGPVVLGGVGLVGLGVFIGLGAAGNAQKARLDELGCKPNCSQSSVGSIRSLYIGADVALGVGLASLVAAGVLLGLHLAAPKQATAVASRIGLVPMTVSSSPFGLAWRF